MNFTRIVRYCGLTLLAFCLLPTFLSAQSSSSGRLEAHFDALTIPRGGYAVGLAYQHNHLRLGVTTFNHRQAGMVVAERNVSIRTSGLGFGADYFLRPGRGFFAGLHTAFHEETLSRTINEDRATQKSIEASLQTGYRWAFGREEENLRGLYLEMVVAAGTRLGAQPVSLGAGTYTPKAIAFQPALRMGYRF
ncbi:hypothetical protein CLV84_1055 [Neolewinella xylanilytica]|uniref:DUF3575 domain-containing protein n=1 Tax=Neolewinella xylanilytica TaxID=1514080 RepID=A0A2S6I9C1_9BACT|nr:hypothetical protein [Neolewinella xylanilytica]PPK88091.1 hypothetical protein CLV84_1055 [Neolewinella xylanilytica]